MKENNNLKQKPDVQKRPSIKKPNFFIVGAPKCGTTALSEYLRTHPNIFMSDPKEPLYFAKDILKIHGLSRPWGEYIELFQDCTNEHFAIGEASPIYLISSVALENIYKFDKNAKIIVMLRNPIDMVQSLHSQRIYGLSEDEEDFEKAWKLQESRRDGQNLPKNCNNAYDLLYKNFALYSDQIEKLFNIFPQEQIKVIFFEDFKQSTKNVYEDILSFLEVPSDGKTEFPIINANKTTRIRWIEAAMRHLFNKLEVPSKKAKKILKIKKFGVDKLFQLNAKRVKRKPLSPSFRLELINEFNEDAEKLSSLLNKDLSNWLK